MVRLFQLTLIIVSLEVSGQDLSVSNIPQDLTKNANVLIRSSRTEFEVINLGKAIEKHEIRVTILNEKGKREAKQYVHYSDLKNLLSLSGELYDRNGRRVKKIKNSEIEDYSASGSNMYTDSRVKLVDFTYPSYPYTISLKYTREHDGLMFYPMWIPQDYSSTAIEDAEFIVKVPKGIEINFYEQFVATEKTDLGNSVEYRWALSNTSAFKTEPYSPPLRELVPLVMVTPGAFEIEGYSGSMSSWETIGAYENSLLAGTQEIPDGLKAEIDVILDGVEDKEERARLVYQFVQNSTRYVSVQLGIGGWKPFDVNYVYENGYGDCKALTNYTMALLEYANIKSIYTSVLAGRGKPDIVTSFPNARFNHVFLAVPIESDTIWLECTSQTNPFGYLGSFTSDRHVLMTSDGSGKLVKTPTYDENDNTQLRKIDIELDKEGNASLRTVTAYSGLQYENVEGQLSNSPNEQRKWLLKNLDLKGLSVSDFEYEHQPDIIPTITESLDLRSEGFAAVTGKRIFFSPNALNQQSYIPRRVDKRTNDVVIKTAYQDIDSVFIKIPEGYYVEHLPAPVETQTRFGEYSGKFTITEEGLFYVRKNVRWQGRYDADSYDELRSMMKEIAKFDKIKVVLAGKT